MAAALAVRGKEAGIGCRAVVADCAYSVSDDWYLALRAVGLAYVVPVAVEYPGRGLPRRRNDASTPAAAGRGTGRGRGGRWPSG
ncbi:hypothetical protein [Streptomyces sp. NPDC087859]|uniref:hypothetical protein n=1 Tax=Streptomyces sp. NPDC087859 TaxID=3365812 RepID=UPI0038234EF5